MGINRTQIRDGEIVLSHLSSELEALISGLTALLQPGIIFYTGADEAPEGFIIADGVAKSRTTYAALFAKYGTTFGAGDGSTTFGIPNLIDRMPIGAGNLYALGATGGAATVTLTAGQIPSHTHSISSDGSHTHAPTSLAFALTQFTGQTAAGTDFAAINAQASATASSGAHTHGGATGSAGSGESHNNLPPYVGLTPLIKT